MDKKINEIKRKLPYYKYGIGHILKLDDINFIIKNYNLFDYTIEDLWEISYETILYNKIDKIDLPLPIIDPDNIVDKLNYINHDTYFLAKDIFDKGSILTYEYQLPERLLMNKNNIYIEKWQILLNSIKKEYYFNTINYYKFIRVIFEISYSISIEYDKKDFNNTDLKKNLDKELIINKYIINDLIEYEKYINIYIELLKKYSYKNIYLIIELKNNYDKKIIENILNDVEYIINKNILKFTFFDLEKYILQKDI
jgi:hypothetical protein